MTNLNAIGLSIHETHCDDDDENKMSLEYQKVYNSQTHPGEDDQSEKGISLCTDYYAINMCTSSPPPSQSPRRDHYQRL